MGNPNLNGFYHGFGLVKGVLAKCLWKCLKETSSHMLMAFWTKEMVK